MRRAGAVSSSIVLYKYNVGCVSIDDVSNDQQYRTDFVIGGRVSPETLAVLRQEIRLYPLPRLRLPKRDFLPAGPIGSDWSPRKFAERESDPEKWVHVVTGVIPADTRIRIARMRREEDMMIGGFSYWIEGVIVDGEHSGTDVFLRNVSKPAYRNGEPATAPIHIPLIEHERPDRISGAP